MKARRRTVETSRQQYLLYVFCGLVTIAVLCMVVPVSVALAAGIAGVSLVLFGLAALVLMILLITRPGLSRVLIVATLILALFGAAVPQLAYVLAAKQADATLAFDPRSYLHFSGNTTIAPSRIVPYKSAGRHQLKLAVYAPTGRASAQAVILLHGGGWRYGSYLQTGQWPETLTSEGMTVISVQYRLSSDSYHTWRDAPRDIHDAIVYAKDHAAELAIDANHLSLLGQSAGGHLALLEAYRNQSVRSVVALYAPIDLSLDYKTSRDKSAELDFIGGPPGQYPDRYQALSPISYVNPASPRTLLIQGKSDDLVAATNTTTLATHLERSQVEHEVLLLPLTGHSFENQRGGFATQIATQKTTVFLNR